MSKHPRLAKRGNRYSFRAKFPKDLQSYFHPSRERVLALGTSDPRDALAKVRVELVKFDQEMIEVRRRIAAAPVTTLNISATEIDRLAAIWTADVMAEDEEARSEGLTDHDYDKLTETLDIVDAGGRQALARGSSSHIEFEVDDLLERNGVKLDKTSEDYRKVTYAISKASVRTTEMQLRRHSGEIIDTPALPSATVSNGDAGVR